jgi:hypothetical protein
MYALTPRLSDGDAQLREQEPLHTALLERSKLWESRRATQDGGAIAQRQTCQLHHLCDFSHMRDSWDEKDRSERSVVRLKILLDRRFVAGAQKLNFGVKKQ